MNAQGWLRRYSTAAPIRDTMPYPCITLARQRRYTMSKKQVSLSWVAFEYHAIGILCRPWALQLSTPCSYSMLTLEAIGPLLGCIDWKKPDSHHSRDGHVFLGFRLYARWGIIQDFWAKLQGRWVFQFGKHTLHVESVELIRCDAFQSVPLTSQMGILTLFVSFLVLRIYGFIFGDPTESITDTAYDLLAANAIFLFPRLFSALGSSYWGQDAYRY